jgi:hypothetical protein
MLQLDGKEDCFWEQFFSIKLDANPHRRELYHSFLDKARAALEHAFSLARSKEEFHIWSMAASSVVDIQVLLHQENINFAYQCLGMLRHAWHGLNDCSKHF